MHWVYPKHCRTNLQIGTYLAGILLSGVMAYVGLTLLSSIRSKFLRVLAAILPATLSTVILIGSGYLFRFFGEYFTGGGVLFLVSEPAYLLDYLHTFLTPLSAGGILLAWSVFFCFWLPGFRQPHTRPPWVFVLFLLSACLAAIAYLTRDNLSAPPDVAAWCSLRRASQLGIERIHLRGVPRALPSHAKAETPWAKTILVVVNESWGTDGVAFAGYPKSGMPLLDNRVARDSSWVAFPKAFTNATATDVSMPSLFTGSRTDDSWDKLHRYPFPWYMAKARGYRIAYVTSQRFQWLNMRDFFFPEGADYLESMETLNAPAVNDAGVDDNLSARKLADYISSIEPDQPLFLVWNSNSMHGPFQEKSEYVKTDTIVGGRWPKAQHILDVALDTLFECLRSTGRLDESFIILTGDHGESEEPHHRPARIYNYYDEIIRIPMAIHVPNSWNTERAQAARQLRTNSKENVQNLDLAPTLAQVLGYRADPANDSLFKDWRGQSLFDALPGDRMIQVLSANDIHTGNREGFALVQREHRLVLSSMEGLQFFDLNVDPNQDHDLWPTLPEAEQKSWLKLICERPLLERIRRSTMALLESPEALQKQK